MLHAVELTQQALLLVLILAGPALIASAVAGLVTGFFSASTQIHDASVAFVPKLVAVAVVVVLTGAWAGATLLRFTHELWRAIPALVR